MAKEVKAKFRKKDGKYIMIGRKLWEMEMNKLFPDDNVEIVGVFRKPTRTRSTLQNGFYWGITIPEVIEGLVDVGYDRYQLSSDVVHDFLVEKFLKFDLPSSEFAGEFISITKRSKELSTVEWMTYQSDIQKWANEFLNVELSVPDEQKRINY